MCEVSKMKRMKIMDMDNDGYEEIIQFIDKNNGYAGLENINKYNGYV